jgi:hypothetical protein
MFKDYPFKMSDKTGEKTLLGVKFYKPRSLGIRSTDQSREKIENKTVSEGVLKREI